LRPFSECIVKLRRVQNWWKMRLTTHLSGGLMMWKHRIQRLWHCIGTIRRYWRIAKYRAKRHLRKNQSHDWHLRLAD